MTTTFDELMRSAAVLIDQAKDLHDAIHAAECEVSDVEAIALSQSCQTASAHCQAARSAALTMQAVAKLRAAPKTHPLAGKTVRMTSESGRRVVAGIVLQNRSIAPVGYHGYSPDPGEWFVQSLRGKTAWPITDKWKPDL